MARMLSRRLLPLLLLLISAVSPCLWDYDTLKQERRRFPTTLELITGQFPRHSDSYYQWRVKDRTERMAAGELSPEMFDDLAVAHSKLGHDQRAIELMGEKEAAHPGLYETVANLGTFHIHAGQLQTGADHVIEAIRINPDAHFGREIYQEMLVRYVLETRAQADHPKLPLQVAPLSHARDAGELGFWSFVLKDRGVGKAGQPEELIRAQRGVMGMMRFGNHTSPVLLEALSDLLLVDRANDAKRLAARALLKASYEVEDEKARAAYRSKAWSVLELGRQSPAPGVPETLPLETLEATFKAELKHAQGWWEKLEAQEKFWIMDGADVDGRFNDVYFSDRTHTIDDGKGRYDAINGYGKYIAGVLVAIGLVLLISLLRR